MGDEITVKVIAIDNLGRINLSRQAVSEELSRVPGAKASDSLSQDYPFKTQRGSRPPQNKQPKTSFTKRD